MSSEASKTDPSDRWIVTQCEACKRELKLPSRPGVDLSEMACPYCSAHLAGDRSGDREASASSARRRRVSPSAKAAAAASLSWEEKPRSEEEDDLNEYVEVDPNNPGEVRVRRVRRKRLLTPAEKVVRTGALAFGGLAALGGLAILIIAVFKGTGTASKDVKRASELPLRIQELIAAAKANETIPPVLTEAETKAAEAILTEYLEADGWANKLPFVHRPETAGLRMQEWYGRAENSDAPVRAGRIVRRDKIFDQGRAIIRIAIETEPAVYKIFALRQSLDDIKIDWESSAGYQEMTLREFQSIKPTAPVPFRVHAKRSDYYNYDFADPETYQCFELTYPGDGDFHLFGYARLDRPEVAQLLQKSQSEQFSCILDLRYPESKVSDNQVEIVDMVSDSWFE